MNMNIDYNIRQSIEALVKLAEYTNSDGRIDTQALEKHLENYAEAITGAAVEMALKKAKQAQAGGT